MSNFSRKSGPGFVLCAYRHCLSQVEHLRPLKNWMRWVKAVVERNAELAASLSAEHVRTAAKIALDRLRESAEPSEGLYAYVLGNSAR